MDAPAGFVTDDVETPEPAGGAMQMQMVQQQQTVTVIMQGEQQGTGSTSAAAPAMLPNAKHPDLCCCAFFIQQSQSGCGVYNSLYKKNTQFAILNFKNGARDILRVKDTGICCYLCLGDNLTACGPGIKFEDMGKPAPIEIPLPQYEERKLLTVCPCLCCAWSLAWDRSKMFQTAYESDFLFCEGGGAGNCLAMEPTCWKLHDETICCELNVAGAKKDNEAFAINLCQTAQSSLCCFLCAGTYKYKTKCPNRCPRSGCNLCVLTPFPLLLGLWDLRLSLPWIGPGFGDILGHPEYVPLKVSLCGISLWESGSFKYYLANRSNKEAGAASLIDNPGMQTTIVQQQTTIAYVPAATQIER